MVAIHEPSGTRYGTVTNISGQFNLQGMRTGGPYKVEVSYVGYQTAIYKGVNLSLGEVYTLNVVLKESSELLDEVIVTAQKTVEKMGTVTNVSERQLTTLPTINVVLLTLLNFLLMRVAVILLPDVMDVIIQ